MPEQDWALERAREAVAKICQLAMIATESWMAPIFAAELRKEREQADALDRTYSIACADMEHAEKRAEAAEKRVAALERIIRDMPLVEHDQAKDAEIARLRDLLGRSMAVRVDGDTWAVPEEDGRWALREWLQVPCSWRKPTARYDTLDQLLAAVDHAKL